MRVELEVPDNKADALLEVLKSISFVKINSISHENTLLKEEIKEAIAELNLVKTGKKKSSKSKRIVKWALICSQ